jgi:hypothetical protein
VKRKRKIIRVRAIQRQLDVKSKKMDARYQLHTDHLSAIDSDRASLIATVGPCTHQPRPEREPYEVPIRAIAYQQLHARAGDAILAKLLALHQPSSFSSPERILATEFSAESQWLLSTKNRDDSRHCGRLSERPCPESYAGGPDVGGNVDLAAHHPERYRSLDRCRRRSRSWRQGEQMQPAMAIRCRRPKGATLHLASEP